LHSSRPSLRNSLAKIQHRHDLWADGDRGDRALDHRSRALRRQSQGARTHSLQISGDGPIGSITADAWLLESGAIGAPRLRPQSASRPCRRCAGEIRRRGRGRRRLVAGDGNRTKSGQPYVGITALHSGEIAEDLAAYLAQSEQIPSVVALGVLAGPDGVIASGGVLAQVLPDANDKAVAELERRALAMPSVTSLVAGGADAESAAARARGEPRSARATQHRRAIYLSMHALEG